MACIDLRGVDPAKYFRTGLYTDLCVERPRLEDDGNTLVKWRYVFRDYGMDHEISKQFLLRHAVPDGSYLIKDISSPADEHAPWAHAANYQECCDKIFDHYHSYLEELKQQFV